MAESLIARRARALRELRVLIEREAETEPAWPVSIQSRELRSYRDARTERREGEAQAVALLRTDN
ncbi:MAG: hypothetical protein M3443_06715 [Actinomycetota bacterium]|nr:hypothetical protein [Actinomycetota bacterium]